MATTEPAEPLRLYLELPRAEVIGAEAPAASPSEAKRRVLFLHQGGGEGGLYGSDRVFRQVVEELHKHIEPYVVLDSEGPLAEERRGLSAEVTVRPLGVLRRRYYTPLGALRCAAITLRASLWLLRYMKAKRIDLVYSSTIGVLAGALAARLSLRRHVWHIHEILVRPKAVARFLSSLVLRLATTVVANSQATAGALDRRRTMRAAQKIVVVYNSVDTAPFDAARRDTVREELGITDGTIAIGLVGRIHYLKGHDYLLKAASLVRAAGEDDFRALIVGDVFDGYESLRQQLEEAAVAAGLGDKVLWLGRREDIADIHGALDVLVAPSTLPESFGLSVAEAMAARTPTIATDHGGPAELIEDGETGFLIPPDDAEIFAARLLELIRDRDLRTRMGDRGRTRVETRFAPQRFANGIRQAILDR